MSGLTRLIAPVAIRLHRFSSALLRRCRRDLNNRLWSNMELRRFAPLFRGDVINVSGWDDRDKEGGRYQNYFTGRTSYAISNIAGERGESGLENEFFLDLTKDLPADMRERFDVVFNHTTLEHIYEIGKATANLCAMSRDVVIIVVPFAQQVHFDEGSFLDFWRPTPFALATMLEENGFEMLYCTRNDNDVYPIYTFCVASKHPERWRQRFPGSLAQSTAASRARLAAQQR
ncbi:MAG TPA: hypothetical protein VFN10_13170 [Thermoanaerobaculia bacterium]|nr:hypothetical protein [Thermoanaerobaculia bacterium]